MAGERFGCDAPPGQPLEETIAWAGANRFAYLDFQADRPPNHLASFDRARVARLRVLCDEHQVALGVHPSSAINSAEDVPIMAEAVDEYLFANLDLARRLGCDHMIAHGGYHFGDRERRQTAALERTLRLIERAQGSGVTLFFENHNREPERSEMHYIPHNVEETRWFLERLPADGCLWAFNVAHGHLVPEGWQGFLDAFGVDRIGQVRLNDNRGDYEVHLVPGEGTIDFDALFVRLTAEGYRGSFCLGFGEAADKIRVRDRFAALL